MLELMQNLKILIFFTMALQVLCLLSIPEMPKTPKGANGTNEKKNAE